MCSSGTIPDCFMHGDSSPAQPIETAKGGCRYLDDVLRHTSRKLGLRSIPSVQVSSVGSKPNIAYDAHPLLQFQNAECDLIPFLDRPL